MAQLAHGSILADTLDGILLDDLAYRLGEKEAGRVESLIRVSMVKFQDLVERLLGNLTDAVTKAPLVEGLLRLSSPLNTLNTRQDNK